MSKEIQYYNSIEAAKILGVNVSTIKRWTDEGKLECIRSAGGHRKFVMSHLSKFLEENRRKTSKVNLFPLENESDLKLSNHILKGNFAYLIDYLKRQAMSCNRDKVQKVFNGLYLAQYPLHVIYDRVVTPLLREFGKLWAEGKLTVVEEHLATSTLRDGIERLQGVIALPGKKQGQALCLSMSAEMHDIALKMVAHILEVRGFKVLYTGQNTPVLSFDQLLKNYKINRICVSSTYVTDKEFSQKEFDIICQLAAENGIEVYVGGNGFDILNFDHPTVVKRIFSFEEVSLV